MRAQLLFTITATAALGLAMAAAAQTKYPSVLEGHAILPAMTLVPAPADAPPELQISGRYATPSPSRAGPNSSSATTITTKLPVAIGSENMPVEIAATAKR